MHSATRFSPFFLDKGRLPRLALNVMMGVDVNKVLGTNYNTAAHDLYHRLQETYKEAHENIKGKQISSKRRYDTKVNVQSFVTGEYAYVWKPPPAHCDYRKFYDPYRGPFKIIKKVTDHTYKIKVGDDKYDTVHMELMKAAPPPSDTTEVKEYDGYDSGGSAGIDETEVRRDSEVGEISRRVDEVIRNRVVDDDERRGLIVMPPSQPTQQGPDRRYPLRNRVQRQPYQHTP